MEFCKAMSDNLEVGEIFQLLYIRAEDMLSATRFVPVFVYYPVKTFIRVSPFSPGEKYVKDYVIEFAENLSGNCVIMILCPSPNDWVEYSYQSVLIPSFCFGDRIADFPDNFRL
jgi:hypothetical protein